MKRFTFTLIIAFFLASSAFAQNWYAGGNFSFQYRTAQGSDDSIIAEFSPTIGYKITDKIDLGLNPIYIYEKNPSSHTLDTNIFGIGIFARYNLLEIEKISILARFGFNYLYGRYNIITRETIIYNPNYSVVRETGKIDINSIGVNIGPVFQYKTMDWLMLYASIGNLSFSHSWGDNNIKSNNIGFSLSTGITLGFNLMF